MPELPEVEAVCRKLRAEVAGRTIHAVHVIRPGIIRPQAMDAFEAAVAGRRILSIERRAKNILMRLSGGAVLRIHLRMTGNLYAVQDVRFRPAATRAYFEFSLHRGILFTDPRALGRMQVHSEAEIQALFEELGPEPLSAAFTIEWFSRTAATCRQPAKLFLMDQARISGLGNIYAAEILFRAGIHPRRIMARLSRPRLSALHGAIVQVVKDAVQSACTAYSGPGHFSEAESFPCLVYDREHHPCLVCGRSVRRIAQGGRSTYYCAGCQK